MSPARRLSLALVLLALGVVLLYLATSQVWFSGRNVGTGFQARASYQGSSQQGLGALALGALAAGAALIATRGRARLLVALLTAVLGGGVVAIAVHTVAERARLLTGPHGSVVTGISTSVWPYIAVLAGILIAIGAAVGALAGRGGSLSTRYEVPVTTPAAVIPGQADVALWQALDRDEDPTVA